jgi:hypothetical protein
MATKEELLSWKGSLDVPTPAQELNTWTIDTTNVSTYAGAVEETTPAPTETTPTESNNLDSFSYSTETQNDNLTNPYDLDRNDVLNKKYAVWQKYADAVASFSKWDIVDKMRLKTGWVADLDSAISNLEVDLNKSRPELMARYASVIDPAKREQLIAKEESNISKQINDLSAVRKYRLWTIKEMADAEIARWEQKLKGLEAQFNLYTSVLWDIEKWDKVQSEIEKTALDLQKQRLELKWLESKYWLEFIPGKTQYWSTDFTSLKDKYPNNASFKNNNPGNIKYNEQWANTLKQYGIEIQKGSEATDGWNFARYNSVEDAIVGRDILLFRTSTYPNMTVDSAMKRYSNNGYWAEVAPWINGSKLMKDLTSAEQTKLIMGQLKWEDQAMYQELLKSWIDPTRLVVEWTYKKTWLTADEQEELDKKEEEKPFEISTVEEFNSKLTEIWTPSKFKEKITMATADEILKDNMTVWNLTKTDEDRLKEVASPKVLKEYKAVKTEKVSSEIVEKLQTAEKATDVVDLVKKLNDTDWVTTDLIWKWLKESWALDRSDIDEWWIWDDKAFNQIEDVIWERPGDSDYFNLW